MGASGIPITICRISDKSFRNQSHDPDVIELIQTILANSPCVVREFYLSVVLFVPLNSDTHIMSKRETILKTIRLPLILTESCQVSSCRRTRERNINGFLNSYFDNNSLTLCLPTKEMSARTTMNHEMNGNGIYGRIPLKVN